jgi:protease I
MVDLVRQTHGKGRTLAAICHGGWMLCFAGVLEGKEVSSSLAIRDDMLHAAAR